jgi:uncharacterized protein
MTKILITGGSGLIGNAISRLLIEKNYQPILLSRKGDELGSIKKYKWDINQAYIDSKAFDGVEHIIHLAGAGIAEKRWTTAYKKEIIDSRVKSSELLFNFISKNNYNIKTLVGSSAIGYYGAEQSEKVITEADSFGNDFLAESCKLWEQSYTPFIDAGIRTAIIRTGVVLSQHAGAYKKMAVPFKFGLGAAIGSGKQYFPWIHINDIAAMFVYALLNEKISGVYNGVATELITNKEFSKQLALSFNKPFFLPPVPAILLKVAMGEGACMVTEGLKISNDKIKQNGFAFKYETLNGALKNLAS